MNQNGKGQKVYRVSLTDEDIQWICVGLRSIAKSGGRGQVRKNHLEALARRMFEHHRGNPNLILHGQLITPTEGANFAP